MWAGGSLTTTSACFPLKSLSNVFSKKKSFGGIKSRFVRRLPRVNKAMAGSNGNSSNWAMERRVEGLVNKHMADMALDTLQHRLSTVSQEMNHLSAEISRREDSKRMEALPRRNDPHFIVGSLPESYTDELVDEKKKLMPNTATSSSSSSSSAGRRRGLRFIPRLNTDTFKLKKNYF